MKLSKKTYELIKKIHLYASLTTLVFFAMYLVSSFVFMNHDTFHPGEAERFTEEVNIMEGQISADNWHPFLSDHGVHGQQTRERSTQNGELIREFNSPETHFTITLAADQQSATIETMHRNKAGVITGFHRTRGYEGPWTYLIYAFMLDVTAISLIIFALTGILLWLNVLKDKRWGWLTLGLGLAYVGGMIGYLMMS